jgi:hypothetical protein
MFENVNLDFGYDFEDTVVQNSNKIRSSCIRTKSTKIMNVNRVNDLKFTIGDLPEKDEIINIIGNGGFDLFSFVPFILEREIINELHLTTWSIAPQNLIELDKYITESNILKTILITGDMTVPRHTKELGIIKRMKKEHNNFEYKIAKLHAKLINVITNNNYYTVIGSANMTKNPRIENAVIFNSYDIYNFNKKWVYDLL